MNLIKLSLKKIFKTKKNFYKFIIGFLILSFIGLLIILKIIHPEIAVASIKTEAIKIPKKTINKTDKYPSFAFREAHKLEFGNASKHYTQSVLINKLNSFPESYTEIETETIVESYPIEDYQSLSVYYSGFDDFAEGANTIQAQRYVDLFFFALVSEEKSKIEVKVDRIEPKLSIDKKQFKDFYLQEPITFNAISEVEAKLFNKENLIGKFEKKDQNFSFYPANGENTLSIFAQDTFENKSEKQTFRFNAFYKEGYKRVDCGLFHFAFDTKTYKEPDGCTNTDYVNSYTELEPVWFKINCDGPCGYTPEGMSIMKSSETYEQELSYYDWSDDPISDMRVIENKDYTTPLGLKGKLINRAGRDFEGGSIITWHFIIDHPKGVLLTHQYIWMSRDQATKDKMKSDFFELIDNMIIE